MERPKPQALPLAIPAAARPASEAVPAATSGGAKGVVVRVLVSLLVVMTVLLAGACVTIPWFVHRAVVDAAAEHGVTLTVQSVEMRMTGFSLQGIEASADAVHGVHLAAPEMDLGECLQTRSVDKSHPRERRVHTVRAKLSLPHMRLELFEIERGRRLVSAPAGSPLTMDYFLIRALAVDLIIELALFVRQ